MAHPFASPKAFFVDTNNAPLASGKLYTYAAGTTTPLATYVDQTEGAANTNPIILDSYGGCELWLGSLAYKLVLKDSSDVTIWTEDNISHINPSSILTAMIGAKQVTTAKIADQAVSTLQLTDSGVTTIKIADANITTVKIATDAITTDKILDSNITTSKILDASVTPAKLTADVQTIVSSYRNFLINGAFDYWQRGISVTVANAASKYLADCWYAKNSLGTSGVLTYSQVSGVTPGSKFGASVKITTAPTAAKVNGCELYQTLDNFSTQDLLNKSASATARIKGLGNVTQVGIQFYYAATEAKVTTAIGSEQLVTVNISTFTLGTLLAQTLSATTIGAAGVVGIRFRIATVSSGNAYDLNNGFVVEQVAINIANLTSGVISFLRQGSNARDELGLCRRHYRKSYDITTAPASATTVGQAQLSAPMAGATTNPMYLPVIFDSPMRATPTIVGYDQTGNVGAVDINNASSAGAYSVSFLNIGQSGFVGGTVAGTTATGVSVYAIGFHWTAEAAI